MTARTRPLAEVLGEFLEQAMEDDITRRINAVAAAVYAEWRDRPNRDAYVDQSIREAAYRAVIAVLEQDYIDVAGTKL